MNAPNARLVPTLTEVLEASSLQLTESPAIEQARLERQRGIVGVPDSESTQQTECDPVCGLKLDPEPNPVTETWSEDRLRADLLSAVDLAIDEFRAQLLLQLELLLSKPRNQR